MSTDEITTLATCIVAAATVVGAYVAIRGLKTWRQQLEGSAHFELARGLLLEVYRVRDAVEAVRHPFMDTSEAAGGDSSEAPWQVVAYEKRWQPVIEAEARLRVCVYEARILWGEAVTDVVEELRGCVKAVYGVLIEYAQLQRSPSQGPLSQEDRELLYWRGDGDAFSARTQSAVERVEAYVRPHLPPPS